MNKIKNLRIKTQILLLAVVMGILMLIVGCNGIFTSYNTANSYNSMLDTDNYRNLLTSEMLNASNDCEGEFYYMIILSEVHHDNEKTKEVHETLLEKVDAFYSITDQFIDNIDNDRTLTAAEREELTACYNDIVDGVDQFAADADKIYDACIHDRDEEVKELVNNITQLVNKMYDDATDLSELGQLRMDASKAEGKKSSSISVVVTIIVLVAAILFGIMLSAAIAAAITNPLKKVTDASSAIAKGNFDIDTRTNMTNEIGLLSNNFGLLVDTFRLLIDDMHTAFRNMNDGDLDSRVHADNYEGTYRDLAVDINQLLENTGNELGVIIESVNEYSNGNFEFTVPRFPGKKANLHEAMDDMKSQLNYISNTISEIISNINAGNLDIDINSENLKGDWEVLVHKLIELVDTVAKPIRTTKYALDQLASANFGYRIDVSEFNGEFKEMAEYINRTTLVLSGYIEEISAVLTQMANQNLDVSINKEYIGDFAKIKDSLELIVGNFNKLIEEIILSSEQVAIGSNSIADSSTSLAQGASEQASAVEELTATINSVAENTVKNTELVLESNNIANKAQESVELVKKEMGDLLESMREINESSNNISAVLQVIDDIAFQTNILALNAAVEAARAGEQGKGFAIVAEEVRNLAARSQEAAKDSSELIQVSVAKAEQGSLIADRTAETINAVTNQIEKISEISNSVAKGSQEQNKSISEINIGINQISEVVSNNTATSEESAAASQELASQSAVFKEMVAKFKIKNRKHLR